MNTTRMVSFGSDLKSRGLTKVHDVRRVVGDRASMTVSKMQSSMQSSPQKWVAIAAASGFAIGMLGRLMQWRREERRHVPQLIVIETSC
jgi:hypothetical protein